MDHKPPEKIEHILGVKVMRLGKPSLSSPLIITNESKDLPEDILNNDLKNDVTSVEGSETLAVGQFLMIPQGFGSINLGESFLSYVFVHNNSTQTARNVTVKAELETDNQTVNLSLLTRSELSPENSIDQVIHHKVTELGKHLLICEVSYTNEEGEALHFKKIFSFTANMPLGLKTKFYNPECDEVFMEAEVQNITAGPINLEKVSLIPSQMFKVTSLNNSDNDEPGDGLLQPDASRQYLYCFTPVFDHAERNSLTALSVGVLDISWRSNLGELGRIQTSSLQRMVPDFGGIKLSVHNLPNIVKIEEPFTFKCKVLNLSKTSVDLILGLDKANPELLWVGTSGRHIGRIEVGCSAIIELTLVPLSAGLHNISGIRLKDSLSNTPYKYDDVAQVFVT